MSYSPSKSFLCVCGRPDSFDKLIACDSCDNWYHVSCQRVDPNEAENIEIFHCLRCKVLVATSQEDSSEVLPQDKSINDDTIIDDNEPLNVASTFSGDTEMPSDAESEPVPEGEFEIEKIVSHRISGRSLYYTVRWKNHSVSEDEEIGSKHLANAHILVEAYRSSVGLTFGQVSKPSRVGFSSVSQDQNEENWLSMDKVFSIIQTYENQRSYNRTISVKIFNNVLDNEDTIYLVQFSTHCLVAMYIYSEKLCYVSDGTNQSSSSSLVRSSLSSMFPDTNIVSVIYNQQKAIDHCASSAVLITLEFKRIYGTGESMPQELSVSRSIRDRLISTFHKERSDPQRGWKPIASNIPCSKCEKCGKEFKCRDKRPYVTHTRNCKI